MSRKTFATLAAFKTADASQMAPRPNATDPDITGTGPIDEVVVTELGAQVYHWCVGNTEPSDDETVLRQTSTFNGVTTERTGGAWKCSARGIIGAAGARRLVTDSTGKVIGVTPATGNRSQASAATTGANQTTGITLAATPAFPAGLRVSMDGVDQELGDGVKTKDFYFSRDGGTTALALSAVEAGDTLFWTKARQQADLATSNLITLDYEVTA